MNITNSRITNDIGRGVLAEDVRDRTVVTNVTISNNQYLAGIQVWKGAGDIWINNTQIEDNWGDGINISYVGGSIDINYTKIMRNTMRGMYLQNSTGSKGSNSPFFANI